VIVSDGVHVLADLDRSGDEPLMLARDLSHTAVLVARQRARAGEIAERELGATVHLLDDGFQHLQLARDIDIVIVSERDTQDRPLPFGRLREPLDALAAADAVVIEGAVRPHRRTQFGLRRSLGDPRPLEPERAWNSGRGPVVAVAGIAEPDRFKTALEQAGWTVAKALWFRDHHRYTRHDVERIARVAAEARASVVTTAKDAMRLLPLRPLPMAIAVVPLILDIEPAAQFQEWLLARLHEVRRARA
jgi:tetraacyldisaccharide 4'-kinase